MFVRCSKTNYASSTGGFKGFQESGHQRKRASIQLKTFRIFAIFPLCLDWGGGGKAAEPGVWSLRKYCILASNTLWTRLEGLKILMLSWKTYGHCNRMCSRTYLNWLCPHTVHTVECQMQHAENTRMFYDIWSYFAVWKPACFSGFTSPQMNWKKSLRPANVRPHLVSPYSNYNFYIVNTLLYYLQLSTVGWRYNS